MISKEQVIERLKTIKYPGFSRDIVSFGIIKDIVIQDSSVTVYLNFTTKDQKIKEQISTLVQEQIESMYDVADVQLQISESQQQPSHAPGGKKTQKLLTDVKYKIAIASGKGGVGKSTVAVNIALALTKQGARVGLLDADIYGPNVPIMMGTHERPKGSDDMILPLEKYGIKIMSIGFFLEDQTPVIWRGPLVGKAIEQLMRDVKWGDLDFFIIDMPPGTGDAQLSISSLTDLDGCLLVSTPQDVALADVIKGVYMFKKVNVEVLGLIENMSYFVCPHCNERTDIFAHGNTKKACKENNVPFIGEIPLDPKIRIGSDTGEPVVMGESDSPQAKAFFDITGQILEKFPSS